MKKKLAITYNQLNIEATATRRFQITMNTPLDELQWKSPEWIQAFGLRTDNVLDYFAESPFFNKTSNNQVIKMQRQFSQAPPDPASQEAKHRSGESEVMTGIPLHQQEQNEFSHLEPARKSLLSRYPVHAMLERELSKMTGIEYVLAYLQEPDFWVIKKQNRLGPQQVQVLQDYYIIGANVYQSPTIFRIVQSRIMAASYHLSDTLDQLHKLTEFQPAQGVQFKKLQPAAITGNGSSGLQNSAPPTAPANGPPSTVTTAQAAQTARTGQLDQNGGRDSQEVITQDMMHRLMLTSIKSTPEYI